MFDKSRAKQSIDDRKKQEGSYLMLNVLLRLMLLQGLKWMHLTLQTQRDAIRGTSQQEKAKKKEALTHT